VNVCLACNIVQGFLSNTGNYCMSIYEAGNLLFFVFFYFMHERSIHRHAIIRIRSFSKWFGQLYLPPSHHTQGTIIFYAINGNNLSVKFQHERQWDFFLVSLSPFVDKYIRWSVYFLRHQPSVYLSLQYRWTWKWSHM
jgi:hypothetical protein